MKKAQGLSLNYVVVGVIGLVVLVVIILIFTSGMKNVKNTTGTTPPTCQELGGNWKKECNNEEREVLAVKDAIEHAGEVCCISTS